MNINILCINNLDILALSIKNNFCSFYLNTYFREEFGFNEKLQKT